MILGPLASFIAIFTAALLAAAGGPTPRQPIGEIVNPSAEALDANNRPAQWTIEPVPRAGATPGGGVAADVAHTGTRSLLVSAAGVSWLNKTLVRPYATYKLAGWIKTEDVPADEEWGARFDVRGVKVTSPARRIQGTADWTRVEITFETEGQDSFIVVATQGGQRPAGRGRSGAPAQTPLLAGRAWFDDVSLELVSARPLRPEVAIDATKTREPMPDLIYGQFIEHLGRCIYGGIWAEMLEDRKFYFRRSARRGAIASMCRRRGGRRATPAR